MSDAPTLAGASTSASPTIEQIDHNVDTERQTAIAVRQCRKGHLSISATSSVPHAESANTDRLTWHGVSEYIEQSTTSSSSRAASSMEPNQSDAEDDADSTVLGHCVSALPLPPEERPSLKGTWPRRTKQFSRCSCASEDTCSSSHGSTSETIGVLDHDFDAYATHFSRPSGPSLRPGVRMGLTSPQRSPSSKCKVSSFAATASQPVSRPLGPPPTVPLPPKPLTSSHNSSGHSLPNGKISPLRRSSRVSAATAVSSISSASVRSSGKSSNQNRISAHLVHASSEHSDTSDISDEELNGIRDISKHFPSPVLPSSLLQKLRRSGSHTSSSSRSPSGSPRTGPGWRPPGSTTHRLLSPVQDHPTDLPLEMLHGRDSPIDGVNGEESNDSALSDVLNLADNQGALMAGVQQHALLSGVSLARVGISSRILSRQASEWSLHRAGQGRDARDRPAASSPGSENLQATQDTQYAPSCKPADASQPLQMHHRQMSKSSKSMSELVAALDLEANEWGERLAHSTGVQPGSDLNDGAQCHKLHWKEFKSPDTQVMRPSAESDGHHALPASESLPSLSPSGSQDLSLDDSHCLTTAESSVVRSDTAKSMSSPRDSIDTAADIGASSEFRSIYDAYRCSTSTMASRFTAPVVRIEGPEGSEVSDSELEDDVSSSDDTPRKRNKPTRKVRLGFDDQRAALRPRPSKLYRAASSPTRPSQTFQSALPPTQEEETPASSVAPAPSSGESADPYAFYQFSPSLPPFMPTGLSPLDLTGRGTWSSIVARASDRMRSRQPSIASLTSFASTTTGPVSVRQIRAAARAKQREVDAAHRIREELSGQIAAMSYRPFAIHDHAASFAAQASMSVDHRSSVSSIFNRGSPTAGIASGRSTSMSSLGHLHSVAPSVGDYGTRWPVGIGADQGVGPDDAASFFAPTPDSLSRRSSACQPQAKVYAEFSMQTSPQASPAISKLPLSSPLTVDDEAARLDAKVGSRARTALTASSQNYLDTDAPLRRRKSAASVLDMYGLDAELDQPGLWPSQIRAPRLSSDLRTRSRGERSVLAAADEELASDEESDLDVSANLEELAERSGVLNTSRGFKRKLRSAIAEVDAIGTEGGESHRPIASIPARSLRVSTALDRIPAQRIARTAGWGGSGEGEHGEDRGVFNTPRTTTSSARPSLPGSAPAQSAKSANLLHRSKSMVALRASSRAELATRASRSSLRMRSPSPDLSILTTQSDEEEVLLTADLDLDPAGLAHTSILDEEFDLMVGKMVTRRVTAIAKPPKAPAVQGSSGEAPSIEVSAKPQMTESQHGSGSSAEAAPRCGGSKESQEVVPPHICSNISPTSSVIEIIREADERLSSTSHSIGHSSGHDTNISDSGGTSGHDPPKPSQILADIIGRRRTTRLQALQTPAFLSSVRSMQDHALEVKSRSAPDKAALGSADDDAMSPNMQDTPDTMAGSEIWTTFHADRSSTASTATTWSMRSTESVQSRVCSIPASESGASVNLVASTAAREGSAATDIDAVNTTLQESEPTSSVGSLKKTDAVNPNAGQSIPILRRKSSGLPVASHTISKQSRPSLPLPAKLDASAPLQAGLEGNNEAVAAHKPVMRRYQSIASLRPRPSDVSKTTSHIVDLATPSKENPVGQDSKKGLRHSDTHGHRATPSKAVRSVGGGITPSKLPSLRIATSTTSLRTQVVADQSSAASLARKSSSGIPHKLPTSDAAGGSGLTSPAGGNVRISGLPLPVPSRSAPAST